MLSYIERHAGERSRTTARTMCSRIRGILRFLYAEGLIAEDLASAIPVMVPRMGGHL